MPLSNGRKNAQKKRSELYKFAKANNLNVQWRMTTSTMENAINAFKKTKAKTIIKTLRKAKLNNDQAALNAINKTTDKVEMNLKRFERIRKKIIAPADKKLLVHFKDENGSVLKTYHIQGQIRNIDNLYINEQDQYSSGADVELDILPTTMVDVEWIDNPKYSKSIRKNYFRYLTKVNYNLNDFQVYYDDWEDRFKMTIVEENSYKEQRETPCFLFALTQAGVDETIVKSISQTMFNSGATVDFIRKTANAFNLYISVKQYYPKSDTGRVDNNISVYGVKTENLIQLGSVGQHLFAIKPTQITKAALDNPKLVNQHQRADFIVKNGKASFKSNRIKLLDSYEVISYLYHNRETLLDPITQTNVPELLNNQFQKIESLTEVDFNASRFKRIGRISPDKTDFNLGRSPFSELIKNKNGKEFIEVNEYNVIYFDFETLVENNEHIPYCVSYCIGRKTQNNVIQFNKTKSFYGIGCELKFLNDLPRKSRNLMWAHNAGFDCRFILKHLTYRKSDTNLIESGTKLKQAHGFFYGREIVIKDTMSFIASKLADMPEMFKSSCNDMALEKECFPHKLVCKYNHLLLWPMDLLDYYEDKETLIANATKINACDDKYFDCEKYAIHYCERDVDVLRNCFEAFRKMFIDRFNIDVYRFMSMPSLAYAIQHNEGCFDDCYTMNGNVLAFVRDAIVGGRVMTRDNEKYHIQHKLADFDAVSLYPSGQSELDGYVRGKPKWFGSPESSKGPLVPHQNTVPNDADYYIARVKFESIDKKRHFPLLSFYEDGSRNFTNDIIGKTMVLGKQAIQDIIEFQEVKITIMEGIYWNEGFNNQIVLTIKSLFEERLKLKKEGNPLQNGIKLLMNSAYGKLIQKPIVKQKVLVSDKKRILEYTIKNINNLISRTPITDDLALFEEHKALSEHFSPAHLGVQVLDSSKHIMNRVMCLAEDIDAKIWYQDTDSMHIDYDAVSRLADAFRKKYNKELIGKQMGQFHVDFDLKGSEGNIYAKESIFLGKKSYLDILACDGNDVQGFHIRMKGIPSKLLESDSYEKYMELYHGNELEFDLSDVCPIKVNNKTQRITTRLNFKRKLSFK